MKHSQGSSAGGTLLAMPTYPLSLPMVCSTADGSCHVWNATAAAWTEGPAMVDNIETEAKAAVTSLQLRDGRVIVGW